MHMSVREIFGGACSFTVANIGEEKIVTHVGGLSVGRVQNFARVYQE